MPEPGIDRSAPFVVAMDAADDPQVVGGKAAALARLLRSGLPIPPWIVVVPDAFQQSLDPITRQELMGDASAAAIAGAISGVFPSPEVCREVSEALRSIAAPDDVVAVRSSAVDEDGATRSFAGQLESFLFVRHADVADRIARVWQSGFHERVVAYRREHGLPGAAQPPSVIVQQMIPADVSGVAFGADPVSGRRDVVVVSAVPGLGTSLVSGECDADCWHVDADNRILDRVIARKALAHRAAVGTVEGIAREPLTADESDRPALDDKQIHAVADLARRCGNVLNGPQDVEWAISNGRLWLLQSRPITTLAQSSNVAGVCSVWDNSNIAESYNGVTTPLTFSFARHAYEGVYREFCRLMGVTPSKLAAHDLAFRRMLGLIRGRIYYNMESWYRTLALLPGFTANRRFMEQMMGVREGLPDSVLAEVESASRRARAADALNFVRSTGGLVLNHLRLRRTIAGFYRRLEDAVGLQAPDLTRMSAEDLTAHYRSLERRLLKRWDAPLINDFFAMIFHGVFKRLTERWCGAEAESLQNNLLRGETGMISVEPARRLHEMATLAAPNTHLVGVLCNGSRDEIEHALRKTPDLYSRYTEYVARFGDRCLEELKLESPTLSDDPLPLLRSVGQMARRRSEGAPRGADNVEAEVRANAERTARTLLQRHVVRRALFFWVLRHARNRVRERENLRFERTRLFGRVRRIFVELGRRFHEVGRLDDARDIFWLEVDEALGFVDGTATTTDLRGLVSVRKAEFDRHRAGTVPDGRFETRGMVHVGNTFQALRKSAAAAHGEEVRGIGCCPGVVQGRVRVVRDPKGVVLERDEVLVALRTDPGWVLLFPAAAGLIVEHGSLLSHSAIVARELGLPAVVSVQGVTDWLRDGDVVELDGSSGVVRRMSAAG